MFNCKGKTDEELVSLALGEADYFLCLMKRYEAKLLRYINRIANIRQEDAEDVLQDSFIKVYENLNNFDDKLKFSSWIYRIVHNQVISNFRKLKARPQQIDWDSENILNNLIADFNISREIDREYLSQKVAQVLEELDDKYQEVLILKYLEDKNYQEISDILKKPMGTIATLLSRAKQQFKKVVKDKKFNL
ncbi:RNA polymerase sigma factor [Candidatus Parcubacteria bacterium]|jgi:RNA polymerase sigma-70 factor, ECF subfamily|nr:RNA polymerase sigma factor [Candidatus Parcubacteria bacterium]